MKCCLHSSSKLKWRRKREPVLTAKTFKNFDESHNFNEFLLKIIKSTFQVLASGRSDASPRLVDILLMINTEGFESLLSVATYPTSLGPVEAKPWMPSRCQLLLILPV